MSSILIPELKRIIAKYLVEKIPTKLLDWIDQDKIDWYFLSQNPSAVSLLKKNPNKINWNFLSKNPSAIPLLQKNPNKIDWHYLSQNPSAISLLEKSRQN